MPKPMMMILHVEEIAFGTIFRRLRNMPGVVRIDLDGEPDEKPMGLDAIQPGGVKRYRGGGGVAKNGKGSDAKGDSAKCIVLAALDVARGPVDPKALMDALEAAGKSRKTFANVTHQLRKGRLAIKRTKGWMLTPRGKKYLHTECRIGEA